MLSSSRRSILIIQFTRSVSVIQISNQSSQIAIKSVTSQSNEEYFYQSDQSPPTLTRLIGIGLF